MPTPSSSGAERDESSIEPFRAANSNSFTGKGTAMTSQERKDLARQRSALLDQVTAVLDSATQAKRQLTSAEKADIENRNREIEDLSYKLNQDANATALRTELAKPTSAAIIGMQPGERSTGRFNNQPAGNPELSMKEITNFLRTGAVVPEISNSSPILESGNSGAAIPTTVLDSVLRAYQGLMPLTAAGATILNTPDGAPLVKPIITGGAAASTFSENDAVSTDDPPGIYTLSFGASKYERLVKASLEALQDVAFDLSREIAAELMAGVAQSFESDATDSLVSDLDGNNHCLVGTAADDYTDILNLIFSVPPRFASDSNKFMLSRHKMASLLDVRASGGSEVPLLNATAKTILGYGFVLNDELDDRIIFGDFNAGVYLRRAPLIIQRLNELYQANDLIGFKAVLRADSQNLASLTDVTVQPLQILSNAVSPP
jgi:HK97 family phage major capsid protein